MSIAECEAILMGGSGRTAGRRTHSRQKETYMGRTAHRKVVRRVLEETAGESTNVWAEVRELIGMCIQIVLLLFLGAVICCVAQ